MNRNYKEQIKEMWQDCPPKGNCNSTKQQYLGKVIDTEAIRRIEKLYG